MQHNNQLTKHLGTKGFTLIEVLIVMIIIAILATLSYVGYRYITQRALSEQYSATIDTYEKAITAYYAKNGEYPNAANETAHTGSGNITTYVSQSCIGGDYRATDRFASGECMRVVSGGTTQSIYVDQSLNNALSPLLSSLPKIDDAQAFSVGDGEGTELRYRGLVYQTQYGIDSNNPGVRQANIAQILYYMAGNAPCARGGKINTAEMAEQGGIELPESMSYTLCLMQFGDGQKSNL